MKKQKSILDAASLQFLQSMMLHQAFGAYLSVLIQEKGWTKTSVSAASAMMSMEAAVIGPILGWFLDQLHQYHNLMDHLYLCLACRV